MTEAELHNLLALLGGMEWIKKEYWDCNDLILQSFDQEYDRLNEQYKNEMEAKKRVCKFPLTTGRK